MNVDRIFLNNIDTYQNVIEYLQENNLLFYFKDKINVDSDMPKNIDKMILMNRMIEMDRVSEISKINDTLKNMGIIPIFFKGSILARMLYKDRYYLRKMGDIDVFVDNKDFNAALEIFYNLGYTLYYKETVFDNHHIMMENGEFVIELHHTILDYRMNIDESYLLSNIVDFEIDRNKLKTFSITATLLHLIYHLYSDIMMNTGYNSFYVNGRLFLPPEKFNFRAFEIAKYIEEFKGDILWNDIISDVSKQSLNLLFYCFIKYIDDIYNIFPEEFISIIKSKCTADFNTINYFRTLTVSQDYILSVPLVNYLNNIWSGVELKINNCRNCLHIDEFDSEKIMNKNSYVIDGQSPSSPTDLSFDFSYWCNKESVFFEIKVIDDKIISCNNRYDSYQSDCIGLIVVNTNPYRFKQIFLFIKKEEGEICCKVRDMNKKRNLRKNTAKADFSLTDNGYIITVELNKKLFGKSGESYFDLLVCDCDKYEDGKKTTMNIFGDVNNWYDVSKFSKIIFE